MECGHRMAARSRLLQRFFRRGDDGAVYFVVPSGGASHDKCATLLDRAAYHWRRGENDRAIEFAEAATKLDPDSDVAALMLACYAIENERFDILGRLLERLPQEATAHMPFAALRAVHIAAMQEISRSDALIEQLAAHHRNDSIFLYARAELYRQRRRWEDSAEQYRMLYELQADFPYGHVHAAEVLTAVGRYREAIEYLNRRLQSQPRNADVYHWLGVCFESLGETSNALQAYREALSIAPERYQTHLRLGTIERNIGHHVAALQHLRIAFNGMPQDIECRRQLVATLVETEQWDDAAALAGELLAGDSPRSDVEMILAIVEHASASEALNRRIDECLLANPDNPWLHYAKGVVSLRQHHYLDAQSSFEESIRRQPSVEAYRGLGTVLSELGDIAGAIAQFTAALDLDRNDLASWRGRCWLYLRAKRPELALADAVRMIELAPDAGEPYYLHARCLLELGNEADALTSLTAALQRDPNCTDAWLTISQLWRKQGEYAQAIYALKQVLSAIPDHVAAHIAMAETQLALGRYNAAKQHIGRVLQLRPDQGETLYLTLGKFLESRHLYSRALELYEDAIERYPDSGDLRFRYGYVALKSGALHLCSRQIEELVTLDPIRAATLRDVYTAFTQPRRER